MTDQVVKYSEYLIEGLNDGQWSWMHVAKSRDAACFESALDAQIAINDLIETQHWSEDELRIAPPTETD